MIGEDVNEEEIGKEMERFNVLMKNLNALQLDYCYVSPALSQCSLTSLSLSSCGIGDGMVSSLLSALVEVKSLSSLSLSHNEIGEEGGVSLAEYISCSVGLSSLDISSNQITDKSGELIAHALQFSADIHSLSLSRNQLGILTGEALVATLHTRTDIVECVCEYAGIPFHEHELMKEQIRRNKVEWDRGEVSRLNVELSEIRKDIHHSHRTYKQLGKKFEEMQRVKERLDFMLYDAGGREREREEREKGTEGKTLRERERELESLREEKQNLINATSTVQHRIANAQANGEFEIDALERVLTKERAVKESLTRSVDMMSQRLTSSRNEVLLLPDERGVFVDAKTLRERENTERQASKNLLGLEVMMIKEFISCLEKDRMEERERERDTERERGISTPHSPSSPSSPSSSKRISLSVSLALANNVPSRNAFTPRAGVGRTLPSPQLPAEPRQAYTPRGRSPLVRRKERKVSKEERERARDFEKPTNGWRQVAVESIDDGESEREKVRERNNTPHSPRSIAFSPAVVSLSPDSP